MAPASPASKGLRTDEVKATKKKKKRVTPSTPSTPSSGVPTTVVGKQMSLVAEASPQLNFESRSSAVAPETETQPLMESEPSVENVDAIQLRLDQVFVGKPDEMDEHWTVLEKWAEKESQVLQGKLLLDKWIQEGIDLTGGPCLELLRSCADASQEALRGLASEVGMLKETAGTIIAGNQSGKALAATDADDLLLRAQRAEETAQEVEERLFEVSNRVGKRRDMLHVVLDGVNNVRLAIKGAPSSKQGKQLQEQLSEIGEMLKAAVEQLDTGLKAVENADALFREEVYPLIHSVCKEAQQVSSLLSTDDQSAAESSGAVEEMKATLETLNKKCEVFAEPSPFDKALRDCIASAEDLAAYRVPKLEPIPQTVTSMFKATAKTVNFASEGVSKALAGVSPELAAKVGGVLGGLGSRNGASALRGKGTKNSLSRWQLPGDDVFLHEEKPRKNWRPLYMAPSFLLLYLLECNIFYESSAVYADGTLFQNNMTEQWYRGQLEPPNATLNCTFGQPLRQAQIGHTADTLGQTLHMLLCPVVLAHSITFPYLLDPPGLLDTLLCFLVFCINVAVCYCKGRKLKRQEHESVLGVFFQIYRAKMDDRHLGMWAVLMLNLFGHAIAAKMIVYSSGDCMRWGDWTGHWDRCVPAQIYEVESNVFFVFIAYACCVFAVVDHGAPEKSWYQDGHCVKKHNHQKVDPVTAAAIKMKVLVRRQMHGKAVPKNVASTLKALASTISKAAGAGEGSDGSDFLDDFAEGIEGIVGDLFSIDVDSIKSAAEGLLESVSGDKEKEEQTQQQVNKEVAEARKKANEPIDIDVQSMVDDVQQTKENIDAMKREEFSWKPHPAECFGGLVGAIISCISMLFLNFADLHWLMPVLDTRCGSGSAQCRADGSLDEASDAWRLTALWRPLDAGVLSTWDGNFDSVVAVITPEWVIMFLWRVFINFILWAVVFGQVDATAESFKAAAKPMQIMGNIVASWAKEGHATTKQLNAWWLARKSLLYNEVALYLDRCDNVVAFYISGMCFLITADVLMLFVFDMEFIPHHIIIIVMLGSCTVIALNQAMSCNTAQNSHIKQLEQLKVALAQDAAKEDVRSCRLMIDEITKVIEKSDYQTKILLCIPLNTAFVSALASYVASACSAVAMKLATEEE